jgi:hypothetical protein
MSDFVSMHLAMEDEMMVLKVAFHFMLLSICLFYKRILPKEHNPSFFEQRLNWEECRDKHEQRGVQTQTTSVTSFILQIAGHDLR